MKKNYVPVYGILPLLASLLLAVSSFCLAGDGFTNRTSGGNTPSSRQALLRHPLPTPAHNVIGDPIRFTLRVNKQAVAPGEEITVTIMATDLNVGSSMLLTFAEAKAFRVKVIMPKGFVQTGGTYADYVETALSPERPSAVYTIKGYFTESSGTGEFRLLRGPRNADASSLFVEKTQLPIVVRGNESARLESANTVTLTANCGASTLTISGSLAIRNPNVSIILYRNNAYIGSISDVPGPSFNRTYPISGNGTYFARVVEVNNDANNITSSVAVNCSSTPNPPAPPTPPVNPTPGSTLAFQIVSYDCTSGVLQYKVTGGNGSSIFLNLPGIISGNVQAGAVLTHVFPGDGRIGRTVSGSASQAGQQIPINFTNGCGQTPPPPITPNPPANCGGGLTGAYINGLDFSQRPVATRIDAQINFTWLDSPIPGVVNPDNFSVRWTGQIEAPVTGMYTFKTFNDDGTKLQVNGQTLIDDPDGHPPVAFQGSIYLTAGKKYPITISYFELGGGAQAQLYWEYPGQASQIVPSCKLYPQ